MALNASSERRDDTLLIALDGELDIYTVATFRETLDGLADGESRVIIDLERISLIDSSGLGALVSLANQLGDRDGRLGLICPVRSLRRVFEITGLRRAFAFGDDFDQTLAALTRPQEESPDPA